MRKPTGLPAAMMIGLMLVLLAALMPAWRPTAGGSVTVPAPDAPVTDDSAAKADAAGEWALAGQLGGNVTDVAWFGHYALLGVGSRLAVIDVSVPELPRWVASSPKLPDLVMGVAVSGDRVYVAAGESGLFVLNGADPLNLRSAGAINLAAAVQDVQVSGDFAYVASLDGLSVVDVLDPAKLQEVAALDDARGPWGCWRIAVGGGVVVMAQWGGKGGSSDGVIVIDVRDPRQPRRVNEWNVEATDVALAGDWAVVAQFGRLLLIDLADPVQQVSIDVGSVPMQLLSVAVEGTIAYAGDESGAVHMIDIDDPRQPRALGRVGEYGDEQLVDVAALAVRSGIVLAPSTHDSDLQIGNCGGGALRVVDATRSAEARVTAMLRLPSSLVRDIDVAADGHSVWVIDASGEVDGPNDTPDFARNIALLVDATDPARPRVRAGLNLPGDAEAVVLAVKGSYVYVLGASLSGMLALHVFDAGDPDAPEFKLAVDLADSIGMWQIERDRVDMSIVGDRLLVNVHGLIHVLDLADPAAPSVVDTPEWWSPELGAVGWVVSDPFAYVVTDSGQAVIVDLRDPAMAHLAAILPIDEFVEDIAASGQTVLVVSNGGAFVSAFDPSSWSNLRELDRVDMHAGNAKLVAFANRAFSMHNSGNLTILDIANPSSLAVLQTLSPVVPVSWAENDIPRAPVIAAAAGQVYASANDLGLLIYASGPAETAPGPDRPHRANFPVAYRAHQRPPTLRRRKLELVGQLGSNGKRIQVSELAANARHAYLAMGEGCTGSLGIVDLARPASPVFASTFDLPFMPVALRVVDGRVYVAGVGCDPAGSGAFAIIDVARPDQPRLIGMLSLPQAVFDLAVAGRWVYVIEVLADNPFPNQDLPKNPGPPHVRIIDAADPAAPREVGSIALDRSSRVTGIAAVNGLILLSDYGLGLRIFNVADPTAPREVASLSIAGAFDVAVEGDRAYVISATDSESSAPQGLWIIDIADPVSPREIGALVGVYYLNPPEDKLAALRIAINEGIAITNSDGGLRAFDVHDPAWPYVLDSVASGSIGVAAAGSRVFTVGEGGLSIFELVDR